MDQRVQIVIALIERDLSRELSLEELAKSVNLSASRLRHLFSAEVGMSPTQYLKMIRLRKAKEMLETTFMSVKQIMCLVGVGDRNHFADNFKKAYGMSPTSYRRLNFKLRV
ncbi:MAG: helix-turn-helix transcriptional regulator [Acidobacteria bacterium]|nr:helix-turn-helix transcriptional regulator [Acidobacteriota bacterium]